MKKQSVVTLAVVSCIATAPVPAAADLKDALLGAAVGAIIQKEVSKNKQSKKVVKKKSSGVVATQPSSLNGQYTREERIRIQAAFRDLGYPIGTVDGVLGPNSRKVIGQYQASLGEAATGQLTRAQYVTLISQVSGPNAVFASRPLQRAEVQMLQEGLRVLGYYGGAIDGSKGPGTIGGLNAFLAQQGLSPAQATPVQSLILVRNVAGLPSAYYLQQEAGAQFASFQQPQPFPQPGQAAPFPQPGQTQQAGFPPPQQGAGGFVNGNQQAVVPGWNGQQGAQPVATPGQIFPAPGQVQQPATGAFPSTQQATLPGWNGQGAQPAAPAAAPLFAAPGQQPQATFPSQQQQPATGGFPATQQAVVPGGNGVNTLQPGAPAPTGGQQTPLFPPATPQQQAPAPIAPQGGTGTLLAGGAQAQQPGVAPTQQSTLDIFSGSGQAQALPNPNQIAGQ